MRATRTQDKPKEPAARTRNRSDRILQGKRIKIATGGKGIYTRLEYPAGVNILNSSSPAGPVDAFARPHPHLQVVFS